MTMKSLILMAAMLAGQAVGVTPSTTGTWAVVGDVMGVPVILTCALVEADHKLSGTCTDDQKRSHALAGVTKDSNVSFAFDTDYEGTPITISMTGVMDDTGGKMSGSIAVAPMAVDGTFSATRQLAAAL
jgi:hypothetical protein